MISEHRGRGTPLYLFRTFLSGSEQSLSVVLPWVVSAHCSAHLTTAFFLIWVLDADTKVPTFSGGKGAGGALPFPPPFSGLFGDDVDKLIARYPSVGGYPLDGDLSVQTV